MLIQRKEAWGFIAYDTRAHKFTYSFDAHMRNDHHPYVSLPLVLNCYTTHECNMSCSHCVARDMKRFDDRPLDVSSQLITTINQSPFLVIVLSGGEPLLPSLESKLLDLLGGIRNKGIIVDTNGTNKPSTTLIAAFRDKDVLVRVSLDSVRPKDEICLRITSKNRNKNEQAYFNKLELISYLSMSGVNVAIQTVLHKRNRSSIMDLPRKIDAWGIRQWFVQRLIPTERIKPRNDSLHDDTYFMDNDDYESVLNQLEKEAFRYNIDCITKRDRRHNCVFLLLNDGRLYTSSDDSNGRIYIGKLGDNEDYFSFVSSSEHSARYYSAKDLTATHSLRKEM
jgi:MoaA/NifB/PqqE/SkfB family radical SAM enzyme